MAKKLFWGQKTTSRKVFFEVQVVLDADCSVGAFVQQAVVYFLIDRAVGSSFAVLFLLELPFFVLLIVFLNLMDHHSLSVGVRILRVKLLQSRPLQLLYWSLIRRL